MIERPGKPPPFPTLADVARAARVSTATVSRCLNAPGSVQEKTRKRVLKTIETIGYAPNFNARALAAKRTSMIGAIIPTMDNAIFARALQSFQETLGAAGYSLVVASTSYAPAAESQHIRNLVSRGADGLLLIGHERDPGIYDFLDTRDVQVLVAWAFDETAPRHSIGFNNRIAMQSLAQKILETGHRRIGMISAPQAHNDRARERVDGVRGALRQAGLPAGALSLIEISYSIENGRIAFRELIKYKIQPTVIICGNDVLAVGAIQMAQSMGLRVPEDVSVTGFDDIELASVVRPRLTTVHVPHRKMGRIAAGMLIECLRSGKALTSVELPTSIQMRETLAPPRTGNRQV